MWEQISLFQDIDTLEDWELAEIKYQKLIKEHTHR